MNPGAKIDDIWITWGVMMLCYMISMKMQGFVPVSVDLNAPKLKKSFSPFTDPAHAAVVKTLANDVLDRSFN